MTTDPYRSPPREAAQTLLEAARTIRLRLLSAPLFFPSCLTAAPARKARPALRRIAHG